MAEADSQRETGDSLYTLSDISQKTGISMPTLQRYKKLYQGRIPSVGNGRKQRYPENALPVFDEIRNENIGRRGRPRKNAAPAAPPARRRGRPPGSGRKAVVETKVAVRRGRRPGRPAKAAKAAIAAVVEKPARRRGRPPGRANRATGGLLTLTQISKTTGISYPTLVRYVRLHSDRLPHEGKGRGRRFYPAAVDVFRQLRQESGRGGRKPGRPAGSGRGRGRAAAAATATATDTSLAQRIRAIEKSQQDIEKRFRGLVQGLQKLLR
ncbi:MAG TPA: hypothetical protein VFE33_08790 [Thermoanaerobaculia bacterium]|nr:hypothetical protein [Thermoanaerobaculia bacterium]